jgi:hypothetical protein
MRMFLGTWAPRKIPMHAQGDEEALARMSNIAELAAVAIHVGSGE